MANGGGEPAMLRWEEDRLLPDAARLPLTGPGAPFEMRPEDVLGASMPVFANRFRTARQMLDSAAERFGDQPFLIFPDRTYTYRGIHAPVAAMAAALRERFGVEPGDRVGIVAANIPGHAVTAWAAVSIGAVVVELNGWWTGPELLHGIELSTPKVVFGDRRRLDRLPSGSVDVPLVCLEDDFDRMVAKWDGSPLPPDSCGEDDPLCILFTSGTTGRAKGAVLSHRCHVNMMQQAALQGALGLLLESTSTASQPGADVPAGPQVSLGVSPMFHISGFSVALIGGAYIGSTIAYPPPGRWDPEVHLEMTERYRAAAWSIVPTQLWRLVEHPRLEEFDLSSLRRIGGGGSTFQPELWRKVREKLPQVSRMATGYGMTETCGAGTHQDGRAAIEHPDAVGAPVPGYEICIRDFAGELIPAGEIGQIHLRGPSNFLGYWDNPRATKDALDADRWYRTGELGRIEHGLLFLEGRGTDLIIRGGENIYPIEIENRLIEHPAIAEVAVIGVPDRVLGEEVKAVVVPQPGATIGLAEVQAWVGEALARFKVPTQLEIRSELPHNAAGKVLKQLLKTGDGAPADPVPTFEEE
jgi:acyl-CoA synthetase (AMP-forming)/AMP-acid ligase II